MAWTPKWTPFSKGLEAELQSDFIVYNRTRKDAKKASRLFYVKFRNPVSRELDTRMSIERIRERLGVYSGTPVRSRNEAICLAKEALDKHLVFSNNEDPCFSDYVCSFWDFDASEYITRRNREKPNSISKCYAVDLLRTVRKHGLPHLPKNIRLREVKAYQIERVKTELQEEGKSSTTINKVLQAMRSPLSEAFRLGQISEDIASRIKNVIMNNATRGIPTSAEVNVMLSKLYASTRYGEYDRIGYLTIALAITTGMRQGEIRALQAEDITIETEDTAFITVRHGYNPYDKLKTTKSKKERIVSAPASLCREILSFGKGNATGNGFVFWTPSSEKEPISAKAIDDYFDKALESAGITKQAKKARNISFHSLRHYYATVMSNAIGSDEARRLLGHSSLKMTDHYTHETEEHLLKLDEARQKAIPFAFPQKR